MWVTHLGPTKREGRVQQARACQEKRTYEEIRMCLGEAPMTLQERPGILRKLTTREIMLRTTVMQPIGKDLGFSVDWLIPQVRS